MLTRYLNYLIPYKKLEDVERYFDVIQAVQDKRRDRPVKHELEKKYQVWSGRMRVTRFIVCLKLVHFVYLWWAQLDPVQATLNQDFIRLAGIDNNLQLLSILFVGMFLVKFDRKLYVDYHPCFLSHFYQVMFHDQVKKHFLPPYLYHGKPIAVLFKRNTFYTINAMQIFVVVLDVFALFQEYNGLVTISKNISYFEAVPNLPRFLAIFLALVYFHLNLFIIIFVGFYLIDVGILLLAITAIGLIWQFIQFDQVRKRCQKLVILSRHLGFALLGMLRFNRRALLLVIQVSYWYGDSFLAFMLLNVPLSGYLMGVLLLGHLDPLWAFFMIVFMAHQWMIMFGFHLLGVRVNREFTRPNRPLLHMAACKQQHLQLRPRLALCLYLQTYHNKNGYGLGYGRYGRISMLSFLKCVMFYIEFVLFSYKIVTGI